MASLVVGALALLFGIAVGSFSERSQRRTPAVGIALLGLMAGLLVGLSQSPIIASVVTASFGLVATLASMYVARPAARAGDASSENSLALDRAVFRRDTAATFVSSAAAEDVERTAESAPPSRDNVAERQGAANDRSRDVSDLDEANTTTSSPPMHREDLETPLHTANGRQADPLLGDSDRLGASSDPGRYKALKIARPLSIDEWLVPFTALAIAGLICGIVIRVNELLLFRPDSRSENLRLEYERQGFTSDQIDRIMDGHAAVLANAAPPRPAPRNESGIGLLNKAELATAEMVLRYAAGIESAAGKLEFIHKQAPQLTTAIGRLRAKGLSDDEIVEALTRQVKDKNTLKGE